MAPHIIHILYFPWDKSHKLKANEEDFDHGPYFTLCKYAPDFEVRLWTLSKARDFCSTLYPEVWAVVEKCPHPTMMVDILRWLVVYHFGGIYWQMSTTPLVELGALLPSPGKDVRLFTEFNMSPEQCRAMAAEPIRHGEPEEPIRVLNQVFSAEPRSVFIQKVLDLVLDRNRTLVPRKDYDILFIGANAALSTAYDRFGKNDAGVELMNREESRRMLKWRYLGSWRRDPRPSAPSRSPATPPVPVLDRWPAFASAYYRWCRRHPHEALVDQIDAVRPRTSCLPPMLPLIEKLGLRSVYEAPCGACDPAVGLPVEYAGGDPSRAVVRENRRRNRGGRVRFQPVNLLYSRFPSVDLFICPDFLEWLSYAEALRVLRRIAVSNPRHIALTGYRFLKDSWDTALGDFRPIDFCAAPFRFPEPMEMMDLPPVAGGRPDRCLMVWKTSDCPADGGMAKEMNGNPGAQP